MAFSTYMPPARKKERDYYVPAMTADVFGVISDFYRIDIVVTLVPPDHKSFIQSTYNFVSRSHIRFL